MSTYEALFEVWFICGGGINIPSTRNVVFSTADSFPGMIEKGISIDCVLKRYRITHEHV